MKRTGLMGVLLLGALLAGCGGSSRATWIVRQPDWEFERYERLAVLTQAAPRDVAGMQAILRDHTQPGAICQHGGPADLHTTAAFVIVPAAGEFYMAAGCPCQHPFLRYTVGERLAFGELDRAQRREYTERP